MADAARPRTVTGPPGRRGIGRDRPALARSTLDRLARGGGARGESWPPETLHALLRLLGAGRPAIAAVESLDQRGIWLRYLPEWARVRNRPQRNAYHRFTVDRHLLETAAGAAALSVGGSARPAAARGPVSRHRQGRRGDHTEVGSTLVGEIGPRLGLPEADVATLQAMVRHHLLLPDAATRRTSTTRPPLRPWPWRWAIVRRWTSGRPDRGRQPRHRPRRVGPMEGGLVARLVEVRPPPGRPTHAGGNAALR